MKSRQEVIKKYLATIESLINARTFYQFLWAKWTIDDLEDILQIPYDDSISCNIGQWVN